MVGRDRKIDGQRPHLARLDDAQNEGAGLRKVASRSQQNRHNEKWQTYAKVKIARNDAYGNADRTSSFEVQRQLAKIGKPVDKREWLMSQPTVNAYYDPQQNNINFPAGILQPPFWDNAMDDAVNYGAIGSVIGHELTHAFDDEGRHFDAVVIFATGGRRPTLKPFEQRADCLVQQYGGYTGDRRREAERQADAWREHGR
jgi:endothelin-converting enzyme/putative endopeptidase